jgi:uncharacterized protein YhhL (DUF1145 family)
MITTIKAATLLLWLIILLNALMPFGEPAHTILNWTGLALIASHAIETLIYLPMIRRAGGSAAMHIVQVMLFGYGHFLVLRQQTGEPAA